MLANEAKVIVDKVITQSLDCLKNTTDANFDDNTNNRQRGRFIELENDEWKNKTESQTPVKWPTIAEFMNEHVGIEKINEYIEKVLLKFANKMFYFTWISKSFILTCIA